MQLRRLPRREESEEGQIFERRRAYVRAAAATEHRRHDEREPLAMPEEAGQR